MINVLKIKIYSTMSSRNYKILTLIQFLLPIYLIVGLLPIPFWYYASVRWVIMAVCIYLAILSFSNDFPISGMLMLCLMFIFRPIYPFILEGILWVGFVLSAIVLFLMNIFYLKENYKRKEEINLPDLTKHLNDNNL